MSFEHQAREYIHDRFNRGVPLELAIQDLIAQKSKKAVAVKAKAFDQVYNVTASMDASLAVTAAAAQSIDNTARQARISIADANAAKQRQQQQQQQLQLRDGSTDGNGRGKGGGSHKKSKAQRRAAQRNQDDDQQVRPWHNQNPHDGNCRRRRRR